jgi:hypothetical protein
VSSRLSLDSQGRKVVIVTAPSAWLVVGQRFLVIDLFDWFIPKGRMPTARERLEPQKRARSRLSQRQGREQSAEPDDAAALTEQTAIDLARREQQREPADLISRAA